jgi:hypothetical protein
VLSTVDYSLQAPSVAGVRGSLTMNILIFGVSPRAAAALLHATGNRLAKGGLPAGSGPEIALSASVARALGVGLGGVVHAGDPQSGPPLRIVGLLQGGPPVAVMPRAYAARNLRAMGASQDLLVLSADPSVTEALPSRYGICRAWRRTCPTRLPGFGCSQERSSPSAWP